MLIFNLLFLVFFYILLYSALHKIIKNYIVSGLPHVETS